LLADFSHLDDGGGKFLAYVSSYKSHMASHPRSRLSSEVIQDHENAIFAMSEKVKPDREEIRGLRLEAVKHMTIEATRQPL
jgi:hypothetical protein